jgi:multiple sugar transport system substrate-binding protein
VVEVVPPPAGPGGIGSLAEGTSAYFMRGSKNPEQARAFVEFLISEEGQKIAMAADSDAVPIVRLPVNKALNAEEVHGDPRWGVFAKTFAEHAHYMPGVPNWTPLRLTTAEGFNRILANCDSDVTAELARTDEAVAADLSAQDALAKAAN